MAGTYTPKANSGTLFKVDNPQSDKHPPYEGEFSMTCPHCQAEGRGWLKAWVNEAKTGAKFFGVKFKFRERQG